MGNTREKRRDKKGRILRTGESQRADGRYAFVYQDVFGKSKFLYSWKLESTDSLPAGKRQCIALREKEKGVMRDIASGIATNGGNYTVFSLVSRYVSQKKGRRKKTNASYDYNLNLLKKEDFGHIRIDKVKTFDAKQFFIKLQQDGKAFNTIRTIRSVIKPAFQMAVDEDLIRKNPFLFDLKDVVYDDSIVREALSKEQEEAFLTFVKNDKRFCVYYDEVYILFNTGIRISEFAGLTPLYIDLKNSEIKINHQLHRINSEYFIEEAKSEKGERILPMTTEVRECFERILKKRHNPKVEPVLYDQKGRAYHGFLVLDKNGMPKVSNHWECHFKSMLAKYNKFNKIHISKLTPHVCRHTYCTNMAKAGMNPKSLQYLMGHANITTTLNIYTHLGYVEAKQEVKRVLEQAN